MGNNVITKDLHIFRGTKDECLSQRTEDMKIYLAWDTHEIFIGNSAGKKVKYGGTKDITSLLADSFEKFRNLLYEEATSRADNLANEKVQEYINSYDSGIQAELRNFNEEINTTFNRLQSEFNDALASTQSAVNSRLNSFDQAIQNISGTDIADLDSKIQLITSRLEELDEATSQEYVDNKIAELRSSVQRTYYTIAAANELLQSIQNSIDEVNGNIQTQSENISNVQNSLTNTINTKIEEVYNAISLKANDNAVYKKNEIDSKLSALNYLRYLSGNEIDSEIASRTDNETLSQFIPAFCTTSFIGDEIEYNMGSIYYYDNEEDEIAETSAGGSGPSYEVINADITQSVTLYKDASSGSSISYIVPDGATRNYQLEISSTQHKIITNIRIENLEAIKSLRVNGVEIPYSTWRTGTITLSQILFTPNQVKDIVSSVEAVPTDSTKRKHYTANNSSLTFNVTQPTLFGNSGNLVNVGLEPTGKFTATITRNQPVYLYTTEKIERITSGGFDVPFILNNENKVILSSQNPVNGITGLDYYEYFLGNINDDTFTITVS